MKHVFASIIIFLPTLATADCFSVGIGSGGGGHHHPTSPGAAAVASSRGGSEMSVSNYTQFVSKSSTENADFFNMNSLNNKAGTPQVIGTNPSTRNATPEDVIPFNTKQSFSIFDVTEEGGYHTSMRAGTVQWLYGLVLSCRLHRRLSMLSEWRGTLPTDFSSQAGLLNMGGVYDLTRRLSVLLTISRSIQGTPDQPSGLASYTGFQFAFN